MLAREHWQGASSPASYPPADKPYEPQSIQLGWMIANPPHGVGLAMFTRGFDNGAYLRCSIPICVCIKICI